MAKKRKANKVFLKLAVLVMLLVIVFYNPVSVRLLTLGVAVYYNLDPLRFYKLIGAESSFRSFAISHQQAIGLGQIRETTAFYIHSRHKRGLLFFPLYNLRLSALYLNYLLKRYNQNWSLALAAYNWGETNVDKRLADKNINRNKDYSSLFADIPETREFIREIM